MLKIKCTTCNSILRKRKRFAKQTEPRACDRPVIVYYASGGGGGLLWFSLFAGEAGACQTVRISRFRLFKPGEGAVRHSYRSRGRCSEWSLNMRAIATPIIAIVTGVSLHLSRPRPYARTHICTSLRGEFAIVTVASPSRRPRRISTGRGDPSASTQVDMSRGRLVFSDLIPNGSEGKRDRAAR